MKCGSLKTQRYGPRRIHCGGCGFTWRPVRKHHRRDSRWLKAYLLDGSTLRRLGSKWKVDHSTVWRRIQRSITTNLELGTVVCLGFPQNLPVVLLDAKHFRIRKVTHTLYVAFDPLRRKPVAWVILPRHEMREGYVRILNVFRMRKSSVEAFVSDWNLSIKGSALEAYPAAIHQRCAAHVLQEVFRKVRGRRFCATQTGKRVWKKLRRIALGFDNEGAARTYLNRVRKKHPLQEKGFKVLDKSLSDIYRFAERPDLPIPRTSNQIENFMGVLEQRLKTFRSVKCPKALLNILSQFIKIKYKSPTN